MILALYIIGSAFAILSLAHKLRDARQQLQRAVWERNAYAAAIQASPSAPLVPSKLDLAAAPLNGRALPSAGAAVSQIDRRAGE